MRLYAAQLTAAQALSANPAALLLGIAALLAGTALAAFLVAAVPTLLVRALIEAIEQAQACIKLSPSPRLHGKQEPGLPEASTLHAASRVTAAGGHAQAARGALLQARALMATLEQELPETAAALRLSGLELSDCFEEVSLLRRARRAGAAALLRVLGRCRARRVSADRDSYTTVSCCVPPI